MSTGNSNTPPKLEKNALFQAMQASGALSLAPKFQNKRGLPDFDQWVGDLANGFSSKPDLIALLIENGFEGFSTMKSLSIARIASGQRCAGAEEVRRRLALPFQGASAREAVKIVGLEKAALFMISLRKGKALPLQEADSIARSMAKAFAGDVDSCSQLLRSGFKGLCRLVEPQLGMLALDLDLSEGHLEGGLPAANIEDAVTSFLWPIWGAVCDNNCSMPNWRDKNLAESLSHLIENGASPECQVEMRKGLFSTALAACCAMGAWEASRVLLAAGANPSGGGSLCPLYLTLRKGSPEALDFAGALIDAGADAMAPAPSGSVFDDSFVDPRVKEGALLEWMIFCGAHRLAAKVVDQAQPGQATARLRKALMALGWEPDLSAKAGSQIEHSILLGASEVGGSEPEDRNKGSMPPAKPRRL